MDASNKLAAEIAAAKEAYNYAIAEAMAQAIEEARKGNRNYMTQYAKEAARLWDIRSVAIEAAKANNSAKHQEVVATGAY